MLFNVALHTNVHIYLCVYSFFGDIIHSGDGVFGTDKPIHTLHILPTPHLLCHACLPSLPQRQPLSGLALTQFCAKFGLSVEEQVCPELDQCVSAVAVCSKETSWGRGVSLRCLVSATVAGSHRRPWQRPPDNHFHGFQGASGGGEEVHCL